MGDNDGAAATFRTGASTKTALTHQSNHEKRPANNQINTNPPNTVKDQLSSTGLEVSSSTEEADTGDRQAVLGNE